MFLHFERIRFAAWQRILSGEKFTVLYHDDNDSDPRFGNGPCWYLGSPHGFVPIWGVESVESVKLMCRNMPLQHAVADMFFVDEGNEKAGSDHRVPIEACLFSCPAPVMRIVEDFSDNDVFKRFLWDDFFSDLPQFGKYIHKCESLFPVDTYFLDQQSESRYREIVNSERAAVLAAKGRLPERAALRFSACFDGTWLCVRSLPYREPFNSLCDIERFLYEHVCELETVYVLDLEYSHRHEVS